MALLVQCGDKLRHPGVEVMALFVQCGDKLSHPGVEVMALFVQCGGQTKSPWGGGNGSLSSVWGQTSE